MDTQSIGTHGMKTAQKIKRNTDIKILELDEIPSAEIYMRQS